MTDGSSDPLQGSPRPEPEARTEFLDLRPGSVVAGKFRIERHISEGGMGVVIAATHLDLDQLVALKFLRSGSSADRQTQVERFVREARAAASLKSEHVTRVLDVGLIEGGPPYMVMEYLDGQSLDRVLHEGGPLPISNVVEYAIQTCEGLAEAHSRGIVHRDVSPSNLFLVKRAPGIGTVKILDFGISKVARSDFSASNVATNIMMGTPCYMSPEQIRSTATVDHRADIWSLGATLYHLLTGKTPFDGTRSLLSLAESIAFDPPPLLRSLRPEIQGSLAAVISRCLSKDRDARYASAGEFALALLPFASAQAREPAERAFSMAPSVPTSSDARAIEEARSAGPSKAAGALRIGRLSLPRGTLVAALAAVMALSGWIASGVHSSPPAKAPVVAIQGKTVVHQAPLAPPPAAPPNDSEPRSASAPVAGPRPIAASAVISRQIRSIGGRGARRIASRPLTTSTPPRAPAIPRPAATPQAPAGPSRSQEVNPAGGRDPLRPIEARNPYERP